MAKKRPFQVTRGILRAEFATVEVEAATAAEAVAKARPLLDDISTADYEPGDVHADFDPPYEATDNNGTTACFDAEGQPVEGQG